MAATRNIGRLLRANRSLTQVVSRSFHGRGQAGVSSQTKTLLLGAAVLGGGYGLYTASKHHLKIEQLVPQTIFPVTHAAANVSSQPSVYSQGKEHALYLWIHLKTGADRKACAKATATLQTYVDRVSPPDLRDEDDEVWAGVGYGPQFYSQVGGKPKENYTYKHRKGPLGEMPSAGGDIFIHAKSNNVSKLFELCQEVMSQLPKGSVEKFDDTYSFVYKNGRDLSGFIDGTENPADDDDRQKVAVEKGTGGSYVITQVWVHKLDTIAREKDSMMEGWVGRTREDSTELKNKPITSHVARMTGGNKFEQKKVHEIVRQSMPYGNLHDKAGLFFIAYAASPLNFDYMLDRMVGTGREDKHSDDVMRLTECTASTYWYFPGVEELKKLS